VYIDISLETLFSLSHVFFNFFCNFHSLRISIIYVSDLAFCQVLLNEYDDDDDACNFDGRLYFLVALYSLSYFPGY